jgi:prepilin-type N-terminal cleavage/methylation domain-containing protein
MVAGFQSKSAIETPKAGVLNQELEMSKGKKTRFGFTLVELLVVIAIIGILAALTTAAVFVTMSMQQRRNTVNTIRVLDKIMHDRWNEVITKSKQETPSAPVMALAGGNGERARVIWAKVRLVEAFPQSYAEMSDPKSIVNNYIPVNDRKTHFKKYQSLVLGKTGGGPGESAACLLMALKTLGANDVALDDQLKYAIVNTDGPNKIDSLTDGWGRPLRFTRFDVSPVVQAANPAVAGNKAFNFADAVDPDGSLLNGTWYPSGLRSQFEIGSATVVGFHTIALVPPTRANYVVPVIASNGKDGTPNNADDILSFQLRGE